MTLPVENARQIAQSMQSGSVRNLIAQSKAKQVLREVNEIPEHFPQFASGLDDRVTFIAYAQLAAGCSLIENEEAADGHVELHAAAEILESAHRTEIGKEPASAFHCLIGAMAFYACGQYSRAFVLIKNVEGITPSAAMIAAYLKKDRSRLISKLNAVLLAPKPEFDDQNQFNDWALSICLARSISLIAEHTISGKQELLANADAILRDAMLISEGGSNASFWWQCRLLKLMLKDYVDEALWSVLPPYFGVEGAAQVENYVKLLAFLTPPVTELWQSQTSSLQLALNTQNRGGVINLRTSAGKTRVAELAILQTLKTNSQAKILYLAPFRSLAFELERTFSKTLSPLGYHVSHLYGGSRFSGVDMELVNEGHITIATPEKAKAMLRAEPELFRSVKLVIIDEGHLLGENERNVRNELFLEHLRLLANRYGARILLLSAVLPNAEDLAAWIGGDVGALVKSDWKPSAERFGVLRWRKSGVSIEWLGGERCFNPQFVEFRQVPKSATTTRSFPATKTEAVAATAVRLAELGPVLIFAGQARWVPSMAKAVLHAVGRDAPAHPWPEIEWKLFETVCSEELGDNAFELTAARLGVICHSNSLPPQVRISVEKLIAKYPPRIIVATTTLGQGVNIGISSVIIATPSIGQQQISKRDFWNICGRAGRAFVDGEGKILYAIDMTQKNWQIKKAEEAAQYYFDRSHLDQVESGLLQMAGYLLQASARVGVSFEALLELVANNDFDPLQEHKENVEGVLDWIDDQLLALHLAYTGDDQNLVANWVDDAFRDSLAAIQERHRNQTAKEGYLLGFLRARVEGVLRKTPPSARRTVIASGLPLSVGLAAFSQLNAFREMVDRYLDSGFSENSLNSFVLEFESWARANAANLVEKMPSEEVLASIRPQWLSGVSLRLIIETYGVEATGICTDLYGYQLPWLFHAIAQKLDKMTEVNRIEALSRVSLLVELGLPTEAAAKVFLAGVRSRAAAIELSQFVINPAISISEIRNTLLEVYIVELSTTVSAAALEWLKFLSEEHGAHKVAYPQCARFRLNTPENVDALHVRKNYSEDRVYLCSVDARFKYAVRSSEELPFEKLADDPRFIFTRDGDVWAQQSRDPRICLI
jgi:hypothetical protein